MINYSRIYTPGQSIAHFVILDLFQDLLLILSNFRTNNVISCFEEILKQVQDDKKQPKLATYSIYCFSNNYRVRVILNNFWNEPAYAGGTKYLAQCVSVG